MEEIKLIIGKTYTLRNGLKTSPLRKSNNGTNYRWEAEVNEPQHQTPSVMAWLASGRYLIAGVDNRYDIIN